MIIVAISTTFERIGMMSKGQFPLDLGVEYVISCQGKKEYDDSYYHSCLSKVFGDNVVWGDASALGLSNNRNNAIKIASEYWADSGHYIYICDDDITISISGLLHAAEIMKSEKLDCLTGIIKTEDGFFKSYEKSSFSHSRLSVARVCSVEILVKLEFLTDNNVFFDNRFGLGSQYPSGEEFIFLNDLITAGGRANFYPIELCQHPPISSGDDFYSTPAKMIAKGAMFKRVFSSYLCYAMIFSFAVKKYKHYRHTVSFAGLCGNMIKGAMEIKK